MAPRKKRAAASKKKASKKKQGKASKSRKRTKRPAKEDEPKPHRRPWISLVLEISSAGFWLWLSWSVAQAASWMPVTAKAVEYGSIETSAHSPGHYEWGRIQEFSQTYTVVAYEFDGIVYEQKVPGTLELGSTTEGVVDPQNPDRWRWRWSGSVWEWLWIVLSGLSAIFFFRRAARRWHPTPPPQ
ncbi:MAG: hypothetical protein AAFQ82_02680 [Myxococcota bacterium]